jgi:hypothetical protein
VLVDDGHPARRMRSGKMRRLKARAAEVLSRRNSLSAADSFTCTASRASCSQGLTLAHFRAQLEDLRERIAHVETQLEHLPDASTGRLGVFGGRSKLKLSGKGQGQLKLSGNGKTCKPMPAAAPSARAPHPGASGRPPCRGLHSSTFQLNLSRFRHKIHLN